MKFQVLCIMFALLQGASSFSPSPHHSFRSKHNFVDEVSARSSKTSRKSLLVREAVPQGSAALAAIGGTCAAGLFSGGLHAIAGPDHLAAILPRCCGQRWYWAGRVGLLWGMGHGASCTLIGAAAFLLKNRLQNNIGSPLKMLLSGASHAMEVAVGLSLILIGFIGIREAREWEDEIDGVQPMSLSSAAADPAVNKSTKRAVLFNGFLHGFSWDGAPSLAPAVAVATWTGNLSFLASYSIGTMTTMAIATTLIGEGTRRAGELFNRPDIPQKMSLISSFLAIAIGCIWTGLAFAR